MQAVIVFTIAAFDFVAHLKLAITTRYRFLFEIEVDVWVVVE